MVPSLVGLEMVVVFKTQESRFERGTMSSAIDMLRLRTSKRKGSEVIRL